MCGLMMIMMKYSENKSHVTIFFSNCFFFITPLSIALELLLEPSWIMGFVLSRHPGQELGGQMMQKLLTAMALFLPCLGLGQLGHTKGLQIRDIRWSEQWRRWNPVLKNASTEWRRADTTNALSQGTNEFWVWRHNGGMTWGRLLSPKCVCNKEPSQAEAWEGESLLDWQDMHGEPVVPCMAVLWPSPPAVSTPESSCSCGDLLQTQH